MKTEEEHKKFGSDIAFGIQQTAACWATDFIDPYVGEKIQLRFEDDKHHMPPGSTWIGEIVGDTSAFFAFLGVQRFAPSVTRGLKKAVKATFGSLLERTGRKELGRLVEKGELEENSAAYDQKLEGWKEFQSDNVAKSAIISVSSIALNVGTQKAMGNTHKLWVIALAKVAGAAITVAGMLGVRFVLPKTTGKLDEELSRRYFTPLIHKTQQVFGAEVTRIPEEKQLLRRHDEGKRKNDLPSGSHAGRLEELRNSEAGQYAR